MAEYAGIFTGIGVLADINIFECKSLLSLESDLLLETEKQAGVD